MLVRGRGVGVVGLMGEDEVFSRELVESNGGDLWEPRCTHPLSLNGSC